MSISLKDDKTKALVNSRYSDVSRNYPNNDDENEDDNVDNDDTPITSCSTMKAKQGSSAFKAIFWLF